MLSLSDYDPVSIIEVPGLVHVSSTKATCEGKGRGKATWGRFIKREGVLEKETEMEMERKQSKGKGY